MGPMVESEARDWVFGLGGRFALTAEISVFGKKEEKFSVLAVGHSPFNLSTLEATFIKTSNPALCRQKVFVHCVKIVH